MEMDGDRMDLNEGVPSEQEISRVSEMDQGNYIHVYNDLIKEEIDVYDDIKEEINVYDDVKEEIDVYDDIREEFHADDDIKEEIVYDDIKEEIVYDDVYYSPEMINNAKDEMSNCSPGGGPGAGSPEWSLSRVAAVCLGLLCVLLLAGIIGLGLHYSVERGQLQSSNINLTRERDQLQSSYNGLARERDQLQTSYNTLMKQRDDLQKILCENFDGWVKFGCSLYYVSTEKKTWEESRQDCIRRGADLVIVNNIEEQVFLSNFKKVVLIGLTDRDVEGNWTWVDGTPLTTTVYWRTGEPTGGASVNCAEIYYYNTGVFMNWFDSNCDVPHYWICERGI